MTIPSSLPPAPLLTPPHARDPLSRRSRPLLLLLISIAIALTTVIAGLIASPTPATAAEPGPGYQSPSRPLDHLGAYLAPDGTMTYCIDVGKPSTVGAVTSDAGTVEQVNDLTPEAMLQLSFVLARHGTTTDARTAAAVAMVVWDIAGTSAYRAIGGDEAVLQRAPESERSAIQTLADRFRAEAAAFEPVVPSAALEVSIDDGDEYTGVLEVALRPASAVGTVTLTNAVFADSGLITRDGIDDGASLPIIGVPPGASPDPAEPVELQPYRVSVESDDFTAAGEPSGTVRLFTTPGAQTLVAASAMVPRVFSATASDTRDRAVPTLATLAQATGLVGSTIRDSAIVEHVPSSGLQLSWSAYLQPPASATPICTPETVVFETDAPLTVTADGTYPSADFTTTEAHAGTIYWIATLVRDDDVVAQGRCGDPAETSVVSPVPPRLPIVSG